jgi:hypothetical protein
MFFARIKPYMHAAKYGHWISWLTTAEYRRRKMEIKISQPFLNSLNLFKELKGKLPPKLIRAAKTYHRKEAYYFASGDILYKAQKAQNRAREARDAAWKSYLDVLIDHKDELEALHAKECGCEYWDGEKLVFREEGVD